MAPIAGVFEALQFDLVYIKEKDGVVRVTLQVRTIARWIFC